MDQILGQTRAIELLQAILGSERVHHAFIFHGPAGVGKCTTAQAFAAIVLCHDREQDLAGRVVACGACESCRLAAAGTHPDLHVINKELARFSDDKNTRDRKLLTIPLNVLRDALLEPVYRSAQLRRGKVFIVDEAELLRDDAQNLLLKTLEEPPEGTHIILVTSSDDRLLPTIRSRCQRIAFVPLPDDLMARELARRSPDLPAQQQQWLLEFANGSLGRLELALRCNLVAWSQSVLPALEAMTQGQVRAELGSQMAQFIDLFATRWVDEHANASKEAANKLATSLMLSMISQHASSQLQRIARACQGLDPEETEPRLDPWLRVIEATATTERMVASNVNLGLAADHLAASLTACLARHELAGAAGSNRV